MSEAVVTYRAESSAFGSDLHLAGADSGDPGLFFDGFLINGEQAAQALLTVAKVAATRFYVPPGMLAAILAAADPVITASHDRLRFESFSLCGGVAVRYDVLPGGLDRPPLATGTTNVDLNPPVRAVLAEVRGTEPLHLAVGTDVAVTTKTAQVVERKVPLPTRWVRGFAEAQAATAGLVEVARLSVPQVRAFLSSVPRSSNSRSVLFALPARSGLRLSVTAGPGAIPLGGAERLRVIEPMLRFARSIRVFAPEQPGAGVSAWLLELTDGRITLTLSPTSGRGFSGEGGLLFELADDRAAADALLISALLSWQPVVDRDWLARSADLSSERVNAALAHLAAAGQVGFDAGEGSYFARVLPWDRGRLEALNPRLTGARELVAAGAVTESGGRFEVRSGEALHLVRRGPDGLVCTCPWYAQHRLGRGPCKHILAVHTIIAAGVAR